VTATGFCFIDTYQVVARKALRHLCQIYEEPIARTPMKFFPPLEKNRQAWRAHIEAFQGKESTGINSKKANIKQKVLVTHLSLPIIQWFV